MRLRDILSVFSMYSKDVALSVNGIANDNNNKKVVGVSRFRVAIQQIEETGAFKDEIDGIRKLHEIVFLSPEDTVILNKDTSEKLYSLTSQLRNKIEISSSVLTAILPPQDQNSISIKLPKIKELKELSEISGSLDKIFNQLLVNNFVNGKVSLQNFDTGSEWIEVLFNSGKEISLICSVIYAALLLKREHIKNREFFEIARNRKITNDIYENLSNQILEENKRLIDEQARAIATEAGADKDNQEYIERVKFCINELHILIDKGLKFFPSSTSPSEIQSKLPDFTKKNIEEMLPEVKKLAEKTSEMETTKDTKPE